MAFEFIFVGTVRNVVHKRLVREMKRLEGALPQGSKTSWFLVESNSEGPESAEALELISETNPRFMFLSLGVDQSGTRIERITRARNEYLRFLRKTFSQAQAEGLICVVADLDGLNKKPRIPLESILKVLQLNEAHFSNQTGPYYDVSALRHEVWNPRDPWRDYADLEGQFGANLAHELAIKSKQLRIPRRLQNIQVDSAFGGLGLYPLKELVQAKAEYSAFDSLGSEQCEHVHFHSELAKVGMRFFIAPQMTNARFTEHTRYLSPFVGSALKLRSFMARQLPESIRKFLEDKFF